MKPLITFVFLSSIFSSIATVAENVSAPLQKFTEKTLIPFPQQTPQIIQAVLAHNAKNLQHEIILQRDKEWKNTTDLTPFMFSLMSNQCAYELFYLTNRHRFIREAFVMGKQGALVCLTHKTSDYWQGDEAKFIKSFAQGQGAFYYAEQAYDESIDELAQQISIPIKHENQVIGVITFTIGLDNWELR